MDSTKIENINVDAYVTLPTPDEIKAQIPMTDELASLVHAYRQTIADILEGKDRRLLMIVGPCSIHDPLAAIDYAERLAKIAHELKDELFIVMRVYFEKPRTTVGWKGLINDPSMNGSFRLDEGLVIARKILKLITTLNLPIATEALDPIIPQYIHDFVSWTAIGARTTESQTHREMASGLSSPVGFKNGTDGGLSVAINAMLSAKSPHSFLGITSAGKIANIKTRGNRYTHIVLRGGIEPNYDVGSIAQCEKALLNVGLPLRIVIDCSHGNSGKDHEKQVAVIGEVVRQIIAGNRSIKGVMIESNINAGNQSLDKSPAFLKYGVSITDKCLDFEMTKHVLTRLAQQLKNAHIDCLINATEMA